jgi:ABC-type nickel/cobalt efflux system permease component RcnA
MDWNASVGLILLAALGIGALHALEPGHGKSIMGAYLVAARGGVRHAFLLGLVVTVTHTIVVFLLAIGALVLAERLATSKVTFWLEVVSGLLVLGVGIWMILTTFNLLRRRGRGGHPHAHSHAHVHPHEHGQAHDHPHVQHQHPHEAQVPEERNPLGLWSLLAVGTSGGLVPCPAALTALLAAVSLGRTGTGIAVIGAMSLGIAVTLIAIGILFVQAGRLMSRMFDSRWVTVHVPRLSAVLITVLGSVLILRTLLFGEHH